MKIVVLGTRGIPDVPGGVETHCQALYPRLVKLGCEVIVLTRKPYIPNPVVSQYKGTRLVHLFAPQRKSLEAIVHTFLGVCFARWESADILHIHAVGPSLLIPFARLVGLKVVMTNHGPDYDRQKWGGMASFMLRLGEKVGGKFANEVIVISDVIAKIVRQRCGRSSHLIYNGVQLPQIAAGTSYLDGLKLERGKYILAVARFVPEKGLHDLIAAFDKIQPDYHLVIAGDSDHEDEYSSRLKASCQHNPRIVLTGYITGDDLHQIYSHARIFVLPSYHEGLPISLLEALSYGLLPLVSDIPANREVDLDGRYYFHCGDVEDLADKLTSLVEIDLTDERKDDFRDFVRAKYNWGEIAEQTVNVYRLVNETSDEGHE